MPETMTSSSDAPTPTGSRPAYPFTASKSPLVCGDFSDVGKGTGRAKPMMIEDGARYDKDFFVLPRHYEPSLDYVLLPKGIVQDRIERLAVDIRET